MNFLEEKMCKKMEKIDKSLLFVQIMNFLEEEMCKKMEKVDKSLIFV